MAWTEERVDVLKTLWNEGLSASQIANRLGGVTRNAVIGKVHRLGLSGRAAPAKPKAMAPKEEAPAVIAPKPTPTPPRREPSVQMDPATWGQGRRTVSSIGANECKWPIGDPASEDFHFCGQGASDGKPYCAYHSQLAFQPNSARRDRQRKAQTALPRIRAVS